MLGPLLPGLVARWNIQDAQAGTLFSASFGGQLVGAWFATRNLRMSLFAGAALTTLGVAALAWVGFPLAHIALFATGLGLSAGLTAGNVVAGHSSQHRARTLALFNVSWSLGAIACPALVRFAGSADTRSFFLVTTAVVAACGVSAAILPRSSTSATPATERSPEVIARLPLGPLIAFSVCMLLYIGNENALGGWLPSFAARSNPGVKAPTVAMLYWLSELVSRLVMALLLFRVPEPVLYRVSLALLLLSVIFLILIPHPSAPLLLGAAVMSGAAIGPVYPLLIAFLLGQFTSHPWIGRLFAVASLGGAFLPWLTGMVSSHFGGLRIGLLVPATGVALMLLMSWAVVGGQAAPLQRRGEPVGEIAETRKGQAPLA